MYDIQWNGIFSFSLFENANHWNLNVSITYVYYIQYMCMKYTHWCRQQAVLIWYTYSSLSIIYISMFLCFHTARATIAWYSTFQCGPIHQNYNTTVDYGFSSTIFALKCCCRTHHNTNAYSILSILSSHCTAFDVSLTQPIEYCINVNVWIETVNT